jgi:hypothetical protein
MLTFVGMAAASKTAADQVTAAAGSNIPRGVEGARNKRAFADVALHALAVLYYVFVGISV